MKSHVLKITAVLFLATTLTNCNSTEKSLQAEKEKEQKELIADIEQFRRNAETKIQEREDELAAFEDKINNGAADAALIAKEKITKLKAMNEDLRLRLKEMQTENKVKWEQFKEEFNRDMDNLGKAIKDLSIDNEK